MADKEAEILTACSHRCRTNILVVAIATLTVYALLFEPRHRHGRIGGGVRVVEFEGMEIEFDIAELEEELDSYNPVHIVDYRSPLDESIFQPQEDGVADRKWDIDDAGQERHDVHGPLGMNMLDFAFGLGPSSPSKSVPSKAIKFHRVWTMADHMISEKGLWSTGDGKKVGAVLDAMSLAQISGVDLLDLGEYGSGTADKWIATLVGGQKVVLKLVWDESEKGGMKEDALCNTGFEMPTSEIAAFHLHRVLGFRNTPYVIGRRIDVLSEILPHASSAVAKKITVQKNNVTCITGTCYNCKSPQSLCRNDSIFEFSMSYWVPRKLKGYTFPPGYMPFSTPRMDQWGAVGFNDHSYCDLVKTTITPYENETFYLDLFDFAVLDSLMYHYDSKHYAIVDHSNAHGLVVRLDHGRAFCAHDRDTFDIFLAPISQCCTLRRSTYYRLKKLKGAGTLTKKLVNFLNHDALAPVLQNPWFSTLERRLKLILSTIDKCISVNGEENVLVVDS